MFPAVGWMGIRHPGWWSNSKALVSPRWRSPLCQGVQNREFGHLGPTKSEEVEALARQSQNGYVDFQISAESTEHVECVDPGAR
ncbi:hypothetical protein C4D60_Mb05t31060 [Musa balbisiana]|uniref:Uncharacterized protein n=1 Tax=Musa balbisiana TaxID=52838 RepID=A0A4S8K030_MUSBA|nr:hypothetical protein C4D60_Mb05t31060 [Musa balbisiana]